MLVLFKKVTICIVFQPYGAQYANVSCDFFFYEHKNAPILKPCF